jgi:hypothetical protein
MTDRRLVGSAARRCRTLHHVVRLTGIIRILTKSIFAVLVYDLVVLNAKTNEFFTLIFAVFV